VFDARHAPALEPDPGDLAPLDDPRAASPRGPGQGGRGRDRVAVARLGLPGGRHQVLGEELGLQPAQLVARDDADVDPTPRWSATFPRARPLASRTPTRKPVRTKPQSAADPLAPLLEDAGLSSAIRAVTSLE
jgi:hypothetical protein